MTEIEFVCRMCGGSKYNLQRDFKYWMCSDCGVIFNSPEHFSLPPVKFIKLKEEAVVPARSKEGDVGYDAVSIEYVKIYSGATVMVQTGISVQLPPNTEMQVRSRSGLAKKHGVMVINSPGTIDPGYRGPCNVLLHNAGTSHYEIKIGDKIAQFLVTPKLPYTFQEVEALDETERGEGGFGHTGR